MEKFTSRKVEDVILLALEAYAETDSNSILSLVAYNIKERILDAQNNEGSYR